MVLESSRFPSTTCWIQRVQEPGSGPEVVQAGTHPGSGEVTVTARALEGFVIAEGATTEWSHTFSTGGGQVPGDRTAEFHLSNTWRGTTDVHFMYGRWADEVFIGDWDGDGRDSIAVRRGNQFHVTNGQRGGGGGGGVPDGRPRGGGPGGGGG